MIEVVLGIMVAVIAIWAGISSTSDEMLKNMPNKPKDENRKKSSGKKYYSGGPPPCRGYYD